MRSRLCKALRYPVLFGFTLLILMSALNQLQEALASGNVIATTASSDATNGSRNLKTFISNGRFWTIYSDGSNMVYSSSTDGFVWTSPTIIRYGILHGSWFGIYFNGTHFAYASAASTPIFFRMGKPLSNGTISWVAPEQSFASGSSPSISFDSNGYVWVGFSFNGYPWVIRDANRDGTWANDSSMPFNSTAIQLTNVTGSWSVYSQPMTNGKMYVFYGLTGNGLDGNGIKARLIIPGFLVPSEEVVTSDPLRFGEAYSSVSYSDNLFVVYTKATGDIAYEYRPSSGPWSSETPVQAGNGNTTYPALSLNTSSNSLVVFWANAPANNMLYYKRCMGGVSCSWDTNPTLLEDESSDGNPVFPSAYWQDGAIGNVHYIALEYETNSSTPNVFNMKFASLSWPPPTPSPPRNLMATGGIRNTTLSWQPPFLSGRAPITSYKIYRGTTSGGESATPLIQLGNVTNYRDTAVTGGVSYFYQVKAVNSLGDSNLSNEATATPRSGPQPPVNLQAHPGYLKITLTWNPPTNNGGSPITGYKIYSGTTSGGESYPITIGNQTTFPIYSLVNGKTYYYKITAINSLGESGSSNEASAAPGTGVSALPMLPFTMLLVTIFSLRVIIRRIPSRRRP
jgi:fibronectin type III domain protein